MKGSTPSGLRHTIRAFTLIELMVVVAIMGVILLAGIPSLYKMMQKEGMRKVSSDMIELCSKARAQAILKGTPMDMVFNPKEHQVRIGNATISTEGGEGGGVPPAPPTGDIDEKPTVIPSGQGLTIPPDFIIEMLDVNLWEYKDSERVRVRFYPNGTSDEMTLVLRSPKNEWKKITLEVTTGLASVDDVIK